MSCPLPICARDRDYIGGLIKFGIETPRIAILGLNPPLREAASYGPSAKRCHETRSLRKQGEALTSADRTCHSVHAARGTY